MAGVGRLGIVAVLSDQPLSNFGAIWALTSRSGGGQKPHRGIGARLRSKCLPPYLEESDPLGTIPRLGQGACHARLAWGKLVLFVSRNGPAAQQDVVALALISSGRQLANVRHTAPRREVVEVSMVYHQSALVPVELQANGTARVRLCEVRLLRVTFRCVWRAALRQLSGNFIFPLPSSATPGPPETQPEFSIAEGVFKDSGTRAYPSRRPHLGELCFTALLQSPWIGVGGLDAPCPLRMKGLAGTRLPFLGSDSL